jgi:hypothetical protein
MPVSCTPQYGVILSHSITTSQAGSPPDLHTYYLGFNKKYGRRALWRRSIWRCDSAYSGLQVPQHEGTKDSSLPRHEAVSLCEWLPTFQRHHTPSKLLDHLTLAGDGNTLHRNVGKHSPNSTVLHPRRHESSGIPLWELQTSHGSKGENRISAKQNTSRARTGMTEPSCNEAQLRHTKQDSRMRLHSWRKAKRRIDLYTEAEVRHMLHEQSKLHGSLLRSCMKETRSEQAVGRGAAHLTGYRWQHNKAHALCKP